MNFDLINFFIMLDTLFAKSKNKDIQSVCINKKDYTCLKGYPFKELQTISAHYGYDLHKNTEAYGFGDKPWAFTLLQDDKREP